MGEEKKSVDKLDEILRDSSEVNVGPSKSGWECKKCGHTEEVIGGEAPIVLKAGGDEMRPCINCLISLLEYANVGNMEKVSCNTVADNGQDN